LTGIELTTGRLVLEASLERLWYSETAKAISVIAAEPRLL
jgi:hypothetical protein